MAVIKSDTFAVGTDTPLENHTSDSGGGWQGGEVDDFDCRASDGRLISSQSGNRFTEGDENPSETHYFAEITDAQFGSSGGVLNTGTSLGVLVRSHMGAGGFFHESDFYWLFHRATDGWYLRRTIGGTTTTLASDANFNSNNSVGAATKVWLKLEVETIDASTVRLTASIALDGGAYSQVSQFDDTDATRITTAGNPGLLMDRSSSDTTQCSIGGFNAEDFTGGGTSGTLVHDTFTDTNNTALTAHTPDTDEVGTGWEDAAIFGSPVVAGSATIQGNQASAGAATNKGAVIDAGEADCIVTVDWTPVASRAVVVLRWLETNNNIIWRLRQPEAEWVLTKTSMVPPAENPTHTPLDSGSFAFDGSGATTYALKVTMSGDSITLFIDGVEVGSAIDAFNNTVTKHGIARSTSDGLDRFDNFRVTVGVLLVGLVGENDVAQSMSAQKTKELGLASATDTGLAVAHQLARTTGQVQETSTALPLFGTALVPVGQVQETDSGLGVTTRKLIGVGQGQSTDDALPMDNSGIVRRVMRWFGMTTSGGE